MPRIRSQTKTILSSPPQEPFSVMGAINQIVVIALLAYSIFTQISTILNTRKANFYEHRYFQPSVFSLLIHWIISGSQIFWAVKCQCALDHLHVSNLPNFNLGTRIWLILIFGRAKEAFFITVPLFIVARKLIEYLLWTVYLNTRASCFLDLNTAHKSNFISLEHLQWPGRALAHARIQIFLRMCA